MDGLDRVIHDAVVMPTTFGSRFLNNEVRKSKDDDEYKTNRTRVCENESLVVGEDT